MTRSPVTTSHRARHLAIVFSALAIVLICALAFSLRTMNVSESLWLDELHTSWVIGDRLIDVWPRAAAGNQPPLYFWLAWIAHQITDPTEASVRVVSVIGGMLLVAAVGWLAWRLTDRISLALLALFAAAIDPDLVFYAQEARPYALMQFLVILHVAFFVERLRRSGWSAGTRPHEFDQSPEQREAQSSRRRARSLGSRIGWVASLVLAYYVHYTAVVILVFETVLLAAVLARTGRPPLAEIKRIGVDTAIALGLFLPSALHIVAIANRGDDWSILLVMWPLPESMSRAVTLYLLPAIGLVTADWIGRRFVRVGATSQASPAGGIGLTTWLAAATLPVLLCWFVSRIGALPLFFPRYLLALLPCVLIGPILAIATSSSNVWRRWSIALVVVFLAFENPMINVRQEDRTQSLKRHEDWKQAVQDLQDIDLSARPVFLFGNLVEDHRLATSSRDDFRRYTEFPVRGLYSLGSDIDLRTRPTLLEERLTEQDVRDLCEQRCATLIVRGHLETVGLVLDEFADKLRPFGLTFDASVDVYGAVFVVDVRVLEPEELEQLRDAAGGG